LTQEKLGVYFWIVELGRDSQRLQQSVATACGDETPATEADLRRILGIKDEDLRDIEETVEEVKEAQRKKKRMVTVCGEDFDSAEDNLRNLFTLLESKVPRCNLGCEGKLSSPLGLKAKRPVRPGGPGGGGKGGGKRRQTRAQREVIGLAGEIVVYRQLEELTGTSIGPHNWKSESSRHFHPDNEADDGLGYDFEVTVGRIKYHLEVKATAGTDFSFEMGTSEIRRALEDRRNERRTRYRVLFVTNALTTNPTVHVLPNPFVQQSMELFRVDKSGLRLTFALEPAPAKSKGRS